MGTFLIFKHEQLAGQGGVYDDFASNHAVNYYIRSIAQNTILVYDPAEKFPDGIRAGPPSANDGGQAYFWMKPPPGANDIDNTPFGHNGGANDVENWTKNRQLGDIAELLAYEDQKSYVYMAGDCTRAYNPAKLDFFTRQIVYLRPGCFVIFDRVQAKNPAFKKTWLLQAMKTPTGAAPNLVITNGQGRLFVQTLLPKEPVVKLNFGDDLYSYGGQSFPPKKDASGPVPQCRVEISPSKEAALDCFLNVLTAADATTNAAPPAEVKTEGNDFVVTVANVKLRFSANAVGGGIELGGKLAKFTTKVKTETEAGR